MSRFDHWRHHSDVWSSDPPFQRPVPDVPVIRAAILMTNVGGLVTNVGGPVVGDTVLATSVVVRSPDIPL